MSSSYEKKNYNQLSDEQAATYNYPKLNESEINKALPKPQPPPPPTQYNVNYNNNTNTNYNPNHPPPAPQNIVYYPQQVAYPYPVNMVQPPVIAVERDHHHHHHHAEDNTYEEMDIGNRHSIEIMCPSCGRAVATTVKNKIGLGTNFAALALLLVGGSCCLCFVPYLIPRCKDAVHYCPDCGARIGTSAFLC